jgi:APA family basic amino acid/polyamine antiporter
VITAVAMALMLPLAAINLRGVGESVKFNVVLTLVEMTALCIVIGVGFYVMTQGTGNAGEIFVFKRLPGIAVLLYMLTAGAVSAPASPAVVLFKTSDDGSWC